MLVFYFLKTAGEWLISALSYGFVAWLMPIIIVGVILSVLGVKMGHLGTAVLKTVGNALVSALTWGVKIIPSIFKGIKKFYFFLSRVVFKMLPAWVAKCLAILIIVII